MKDTNVHHTDSNQREDLRHTDTIAAGTSLDADPAGYEQSINPVGEVPVGTEGMDLPSDDTASVAERAGRDPSNLGDDVPSQGDIVHPAPINDPIGRTPGM
jgi:hypothetical protein